MNSTWRAHNHATNEILECPILANLIEAIKDTAVFNPENHITNWTFRYGGRDKNEK